MNRDNINAFISGLYLDTWYKNLPYDIVKKSGVYNQCKLYETAWASIVINTRVSSVWKNAFAQQGGQD